MKALCIGVMLPLEDLMEAEESLKELAELAKTAEYEVTDQLLLSSSQIFAATYISKNIAEDIVMEIEEQDTEVVLFNEELSPAQLKNLEELWNVRIVDRTELILRIFQIHARTQEARIQVEIAQLHYTLPRLKRMWTHLSRIEGGIGFSKGPGETQIELDRRIIKERISKLSKKLKKISVRRETRRKKRLEASIPLASLVGYTNAGKTSLLNVLAKEHRLAEDKLFATLSPVVRKIFLKDSDYCLLSDTVGFITKLPTHLVASFRSTLQEIEFSDILIVVQDVTHFQLGRQRKAVENTLGQLEVLKKPQILVLSKVDLLSEAEKDEYKSLYPEAVLLSSKTLEGINELKERIYNVSKKLSTLS